MSVLASKDPLPLFGGWARNAAAGMVFGGSLVCFFVAFWLGWSSGLSGERRGDEGVRDVLVALAVLAFGSTFAVLFVGFFLMDIVVRIKKLDDRLRAPPDDPTRGRGPAVG
jgi:hypothetical protein